MADDFKTEKPAGSSAAKKGAVPPVSVPLEKPPYQGIPEVTQERGAAKKK